MPRTIGRTGRSEAHREAKLTAPTRSTAATSASRHEEFQVHYGTARVGGAVREVRGGKRGHVRHRAAAPSPSSEPDAGADPGADTSADPGPDPGEVYFVTSLHHHAFSTRPTNFVTFSNFLKRVTPPL